MISIRSCTFETNSSSCHVITFTSKDWEVRPLEKPIALKFQGGSFMWEFCSYDDPQSKLSYWFCAFKEWQRELLLKENARVLGYDPYRKYGAEPVLDDEVFKKHVEQVAQFIKSVYEEFNKYNVQLTFDGDNYLRDFNEYTNKHFNTIDEYLDCFKTVNIKEHVCDSLGFLNYVIWEGAGIDHQSSPREDLDCETLASLDVIEVVRWVLGDGYFKTGNDND